MRVKDRHVVVTGGANGIGAALARRFAAEGARVVVADLDEESLMRVAAEVGGLGVPTDVRDEHQIASLVVAAESQFGAIDLFCSNAGIVVPGGEDASDAAWERSIGVNVLAHVYAARVLVPRMLARGEGYLLNTASAAGLLTQIGSAPYSVTKHAAVALAEWLAITYGDAGLKVSVLCPQAVRTNMTAGTVEGGVAGVDGMLEPDDVADAVIAGLAAESFLILPHPVVGDYFKRKADDYDRWLRGMRRLQARYIGEAGEP
ncbi:MAG TPA: SDR family oxidoreductase [Acidimicrobiia bacterium]|jgi:NAD(P)-dependent dehydrogenase (short-subunit alcohol dehydrogenase family)|nr:SDR family oxidoreductase [Acidimicrobiia bacterium]